MSIDLIEKANAISRHVTNITYPSRVSSEHVRNVVRDLLKEVAALKARLARYEARDEADADQL